MKKRKFLVISSHLDDMPTGLGGLVAKLIGLGHEVLSVVAFTPAEEEECRARRSEEIRANNILGNYSHIFSGFCEQSDAGLNLLRGQINDLLESYRPDVILSHWPVDVHPDHRLAAALTIEPCFQKGVNIEFFAFEVLSAPGRPQSLGFIPTHYVSLDAEEVAKKRAAVMCYESQHPEELWEAHSEMQRNRGSEISCLNAEAFVRLTRWGELDSELSEIFWPTPFRLPRGMGIDVSPKKIGLNF